MRSRTVRSSAAVLMASLSFSLSGRDEVRALAEIRSELRAASASHRAPGWLFADDIVCVDTAGRIVRGDDAGEEVAVVARTIEPQLVEATSGAVVTLGTTRTGLAALQLWTRTRRGWRLAAQQATSPSLRDVIEDHESQGVPSTFGTDRDLRGIHRVHESLVRAATRRESRPFLDLTSTNYVEVTLTDRKTRAQLLADLDATALQDDAPLAQATRVFAGAAVSVTVNQAGTAVTSSYYINEAGRWRLVALIATPIVSRCGERPSPLVTQAKGRAC